MVANLLVGGGGITNHFIIRKEVYNMTIEEALTKIAEGVDDIQNYSEEFDFLRGIDVSNPTESEEYKNLTKDYDDLKKKYKARFIESLTKPKNTTEDDDDVIDDDVIEDDESKEIDISELDLTGEND